MQKEFGQGFRPEPAHLGIFEPKGWGTTFGVLRMSCRFWTFKLGASPLRALRGKNMFRFWTFKLGASPLRSLRGENMFRFWTFKLVYYYLTRHFPLRPARRPTSILGHIPDQHAQEKISA